jgi:hypothetical protein
MFGFLKLFRFAFGFGFAQSLELGFGHWFDDPIGSTVNAISGVANAIGDGVSSVVHTITDHPLEAVATAAAAYFTMGGSLWADAAITSAGAAGTTAAAAGEAGAAAAAGGTAAAAGGLTAGTVASYAKIVSMVGMGMSITGKVTGSKELQTIGGDLALAGGAISLGAMGFSSLTAAPAAPIDTVGALDYTAPPMDMSTGLPSTGVNPDGTPVSTLDNSGMPNPLSNVKPVSSGFGTTAATAPVLDGTPASITKNTTNYPQLAQAETAAPNAATTPPPAASTGSQTVSITAGADKSNVYISNGSVIDPSQIPASARNLSQGQQFTMTGSGAGATASNIMTSPPAQTSLLDKAGAIFTNPTTGSMALAGIGGGLSAYETSKLKQQQLLLSQQQLAAQYGGANNVPNMVSYTAQAKPPVAGIINSSKTRGA